MTNYNLSEFELLLQANPAKPSPALRSIVSGTVIKKTDCGYYVDIGGKSESFVKEKEPSDSQVWLGCQYQFMVTGEADENGSVSLSRQKALTWFELDLMRQLETVSLVKITSVSFSRSGRPCGLNCTISGIKAFVPRSEISQKQNLQELLNQEIPVIVLQLDLKQEPEGVAILSNKKAVDGIFMTQVEEFSPSASITCRVTNVLKNGVRVTLPNSLQAFIPRSELVYDRKVNPSEIVQVGDQLEAKILKLDWQEQNILLSRRAHLQDQFLLKLERGQKLVGTVSRLSDFALFVEVGNCMDAILYRKKPDQDPIQPGQKIEAEVMQVKAKEGKLVLSRKFRMLSSQSA